MPKPHKQSKRIIDYLNALIDKGDLDQKQLHKKLPGISQQAISSWMTYNSGPTPKSVERLKLLFPELEVILKNDTPARNNQVDDVEAVKYVRSDYAAQSEVLKEKISSLMTEVTLKNKLIESMEREISTLRGWLREHQDRQSKGKINHDALDGGNI